MAPPRKPTALKMLHGETRPGRVNYDEPLPGPDEPVMPSDLSDAQAAAWREVTRNLRIMGLLHAPDTAVITAYVVISEKLDRLRIKMTNEPDVVRNPANGMPMQNPVFDQWLKACTKMESLASKLGLNPSARSGIRSKNAVTGAPTRGGAERLFGV